MLFEESFHFILVLKFMFIVVFVVFLYYLFDLCKLCSDKCCFIHDVSNSCFPSYLASLARGFPILLSFQRVRVFWGVFSSLESLVLLFFDENFIDFFFSIFYSCEYLCFLLLSLLLLFLGSQRFLLLLFVSRLSEFSKIRVLTWNTSFF